MTTTKRTEFNHCSDIIDYRSSSDGYLKTGLSVSSMKKRPWSASTDMATKSTAATTHTRLTKHSAFGRVTITRLSMEAGTATQLS